MGIKLIANGTVAPWHSKVIPPVTRGLEGWFTFDTDANRFNFNRALGKADAELIGVPVAYATHGRFKGLSNYLKTSIIDTSGMTLIAVGKAVSAVGNEPAGGPNAPFYVGGFVGTSIDPAYPGTGYGVSLFHGTPSGLTGNGGRVNAGGTGPSSGPVVIPNDVPSDWGIRAVRADANLTSVFNLTRGLKVDGTLLTPRVVGDSKIRIGGASSTFAAEVDISAVAIYSVPLNDAEINQVATVMRARMRRLGITV